jgi:hypothetical protein
MAVDFASTHENPFRLSPQTSPRYLNSQHLSSSLALPNYSHNARCYHYAS